MSVRRTQGSRTPKQLESTDEARERSLGGTVRDQNNDATGSSVTARERTAEEPVREQGNDPAGASPSARALQVVMGDWKAVLRSLTVVGFVVFAIWVSDVYVKFWEFEIGQRATDTCRAPEVVHVPVPMPAPPQLPPPAEPAVSDPAI
jgi:hypothetical protein